MHQGPLFYNCVPASTGPGPRTSGVTAQPVVLGSWVPACYTVRMSEATFRSRAGASLRKEGVLVQRFEDQFGSGIPDSFIGTPDFGAWLESKWKVWPKRASTPLNVDNLTGPQRNFLLLAWKRPCYSGVLFGSPAGWFVAPAPLMGDLLFHRPCSELEARLTQGPVTLAGIKRYFLEEM